MKNNRFVTFKTKILRFELFILALFLLFFTVFLLDNIAFFKLYNETVMKKSLAQLKQTIDIAIGSNIDYDLFRFVDSKSNFIINTDSSELDHISRYENNIYMRNLLRIMMISNPLIRRITIYTTKTSSFSSETLNSADYLTKMKNIINREELGSNTDEYITLPYTDKRGNINVELITKILPIRQQAQNDPFAFLFLDLDYSKISGMLDDSYSNADLESRFLIFRDLDIVFISGFDNSYYDDIRDNVLLNLVDHLRNGTEHASILIGNQQHIYSIVIDDSTGWYYVSFLPFSTFEDKLLHNIRLVIFFAALIIIIIISSSMIFARRVSMPINVLKKLMSEAETGEVKLYNTANIRNDEIGDLISHYNRMGDRINSGVLNTYISQVNQKHAELKMLQFQVNPHFLYNTLSTASSIAKLNNIPEIESIMTSLSELFRYNIKGSNYVLFRDELYQLSNYIRIQKIRFPEKFDVEMNIPEDLMDYSVLKFILQPVIENSFEHGLRNNSSSNKIKVSATRHNENQLLIEVWDNGVGIEGSIVYDMNRSFRQAQKDGEAFDSETMEIGLSNVNVRVKNFYGSEYGIELESILNNYTLVRIRLAIRNDENDT